MFILVDPNKLKVLWNSFRIGLCDVKHFEIVSGGKFKPTTTQLSCAEEADAIAARMKNLNYVRVGTERMIPTPPHFGAQLNSEHAKAKLTDYLGASCSQKNIIRDISLFVDFIFFEISSLDELIIPFECEGVEIQGLSAQYSPDLNCTVFFRGLN
ncbi:hypothetical protein [Metapseudomonas otitidis]|uniref:hypothetical protein n=1 Tax=Metapseudomonas otitidis TaxID=319939 RepID=UPI0026245F67|nr:hypothetical protein [Pseudomonas otitidis]